MRLVSTVTVIGDKKLGFPEIYINDEWGTIHANDTSSAGDGAAPIICRQLGALDGGYVQKYK